MMQRARTLICACAAELVATAALAGTVTGVTVEPRAPVVGNPVTVSVTGTNPCGAVFIDYGDGTAITYPITGLPVSKAHPFAQGGRYTITAKGMGNCDGEVTTAVEVKGPPPPPPGATPQISAVTITPAAGRVREANTIAIEGSGPCAYTINFGDGNAEESNGFPRRIRHTYGAAGTYVVTVTPSPPCSGRFTERVTIAGPDKARPAEITGMTVTPSFVRPGRPVTIEVTGSGRCTYRLEFGDDNTYSREQSLPDRVQHTFNAEDSYSVIAVALSPCTGSARAIVNVFYY